MKSISDNDMELVNALVAALVRKSRFYNDPNAKKRKQPSRDQTKKDVVDEVLSGFTSKYAEDTRVVPSDKDLRRMYDVIQADANLTKRIAGLGFGSTGDAYRKAAIKLQIMALMNVLRDGKNIRNDIVHKPGYVPSESSTARALSEYAQADKGISDFLNRKA